MTKATLERIIATAAVTASISLNASIALNTGALAATPAPAASSAGAESAASAYQSMRELWDTCSRIKATAIDLLSEGRNSPARRRWTDYYLSQLQQDVANLKSATSAKALPAVQTSAFAAQWTESQDDIAKIDAAVSQLATELAAVKSPTDSRYPAPFWRPASELSQAAEKLDKSIIAIFSVLDTSVDQSSPSTQNAITKLSNQMQSANASASSEPLKGYAKTVNTETGIKQIDEACKKVGKACWGLFGELERWNLLYGKPPSGGIGDMFYGGGLTKEEVLSQYKYLPQFAFTNAPYVMLYSYRLPPRQNMLAYHTKQIGKLLNLIEGDMNDMQIPADRQLALAGPWEDAKKLFVECRNKYLGLVTAIDNTNDDRLQKNIREDQVTIGQPVMTIYADMAKLQDALADMNKLVQ